jgi:hypothetical protein
MTYYRIYNNETGRYAGQSSTDLNWLRQEAGRLDDKAECRGLYTVLPSPPKQ